MRLPRGKRLATGSIDFADGRLVASPSLLEIVIDATATWATCEDVSHSV
jgi:hypothetical protein